MSKNRNSHKSAARNRNRRNRKGLPFGLVLGGLALIAIAVISASGRGASSIQIEYSPEDVVYDSPLYAVHEMTPPTLSAIQFYPKDQPQPEIVVSELYYDFGSIGPDEVVTHTFIIANYGDAPLTIHRAYTTCGCTTADFTATTIPPGKVVLMTLVLDAGFHDVRGQTVRRGVIIENNDPNHSQIEIWTQANVRNTP